MMALMCYSSNCHAQVKKSAKPHKRSKIKGLLIQVNNRSVLENKKFQKLIEEEKLLKSNFFHTLKVQKYILQSESKAIEKNFIRLCEIIVKEFPDILKCEADLSLDVLSRTQENIECVDPILNQLNSSIENSIHSLQNVVSSEFCNLFVTDIEQHNYIGTKRPFIKADPNSTLLWAQEYTGLDLLKDMLKEQAIDTSSVSEIVDIWDSNSYDHGNMVANLVAGPYQTSSITTKSPFNYTDLTLTSDYLTAYETEYHNCKEKGICPRLINNSMGWKGSDIIKDTVAKISTEKNSVFVLAAGNDKEEISDVKNQSSKDGHSILVISHDPNGLSSKFTNFSEEVVISAPSDNSILTYDRNGIPKLFGGTSGAAPLVTSTLASFELITKSNLSTTEFIQLLKKTAIKFSVDDRVVTGAGYLNSYKIGKIALRLKNLCSKYQKVNIRNQCFSKALGNEDLYDFKREVDTEQLSSKFKAAFPLCDITQNNKNQNVDNVSCEEKVYVLKELRKAAFLLPENPNLWKHLSCIHKLAGFTTNANYYSRIASRERFTHEELDTLDLSISDLVDLLKTKPSLQSNRDFFRKTLHSHPSLLKFASSNIKEDKELVLKALSQDGDSLEYVSENFKNDPSIVLTALKDYTAIQYASEELLNNRQFLIEAVKKNVWSLEFIPAHFLDDKSFSLEIVKVNGLAIEYLSIEKRNDKEIALAAISQNPNAFEFISDSLKEEFKENSK